MQTKSCNTCKAVKPLQDFYPVKDGKFGRAAVCKPCRLLAHKRYNGTPKILARNNRQNFKRRGITTLDYLTMLLRQNYGCAICATTKPGGKGRFHIDHCHATGKIRGLLCHHCNVMLGHAKDRVEILATAITYLSRHK